MVELLKKPNQTTIYIEQQQILFFLNWEIRKQNVRSTLKSIFVNICFLGMERKKRNHASSSSDCRYKRDLICIGLESYLSGNLKSNLVPYSMSHSYGSVCVCEHNAC